MKAAIWGAGNIAASHVQALKSAGISIHAVVDIHADKAKTFAQRWNIRHWGCQPDLLLDEAITCVHVCTPPALHYKMILYLLEQDKHVLCEKPLCLDASEAAILTRKAQEKQLLCCVNHNIRFYDACREIKQHINQNKAGPLYMIHGSYLQAFHALPAPYDWRYDQSVAGKMRAVTEIGSHWFDLAMYLSGQSIQRVSACFKTFRPHRRLENKTMYPADTLTADLTVDSEDAAFIRLEFSGGTFGQVTLSEVSHGRQNRLSIELTGEKETLWWHSEAISTFHYAQKAGDIQTQIFAFGNNGFNDSFRSLISNYYDVLKHTSFADSERFSHLLPTFADGGRITAVCHAAWISNQNDGKWVDVHWEV